MKFFSRESLSAHTKYILFKWFLGPQPSGIFRISSSSKLKLHFRAAAKVGTLYLGIFFFSFKPRELAESIMTLLFTHKRIMQEKWCKESEEVP